MAEDRHIYGARIREKLDRPISLVGMMGVGKSRIGRQLARALGLPFVDSDEEIESAAGMTISEIFERFGEPYFRDGEKKIIRRLVEDGVQVVSTGGGAPMTPETEQLLWEKTIAVWIRADLSVMVERTSGNAKRPLLANGDPAEILRTLCEKRYPVYGRAPIVIDSHPLPLDEILGDLLQKLDRHLSGRLSGHVSAHSVAGETEGSHDA